MTLLRDRTDFPELLDAAAESFGIPNAAIVEKDYYVTEALRTIARDFGTRTLFKGGTSLSKGWRIIDRFSEDIDLYVDREDRGTKATNTLLKSVEAAVTAHPALELAEVVGRIDGVARSTTFRYRSTTALDGLNHVVLLESGIQSGTYPTETRNLTSLLSEFLDAKDIPRETDDRKPFPMNLLHFRRTFVEKLFALHHKVERDLLERQKPLGSYARHYYDLAQLTLRPEVQAMLDSDEYLQIAQDYRQLTSTYFKNQLLPPRMALQDSKALFPTEDLRRTLETDYRIECQRLCYGAFPTFKEVLTRFESIRDRLVPLPD